MELPVRVMAQRNMFVGCLLQPQSIAGTSPHHIAGAGGRLRSRDRLQRLQVHRKLKDRRVRLRYLQDRRHLGSWALLLGPLFLQERNRRWGQWARRACPRLTGISRWVRLLDQGRWGQ